MIRLVKTSSGEVEIDLTGKKSGRGAYICRSSECVAAAVKKKGFERALRTAVSADLLNELMVVVQENENENADR